MRAARGFTLVELLVVIAIVAMIASLAPLAYSRLNATAQYRATVRAALTDLRSARHQARTTGRDAFFAVDLRSRTFGVEGGPERSVPAELALGAAMAAAESTADGRRAIRFLPQGGASGGSIDLIRPSGAGVRLRVDWFSGRVEQEAIGP